MLNQLHLSTIVSGSTQNNDTEYTGNRVIKEQGMHEASREIKVVVSSNSNQNVHSHGMGFQNVCYENGHARKATSRPDCNYNMLMCFGWVGNSR